NQREIVAGKTPPIAVLNGIDEPFVNTDFVAAVKFSNLWEGKAHLLDKSGHAPFWDSPDRFNPVFARFLASVDQA
ncbi:alpha/beta hydrolase, partial [Mesorhizobium sp. M8A.F.Ca.ET.059.01.1.1]